MGTEFFKTRSSKQLEKRLLGCSLNVVLLMKEFEELTASLRSKLEGVASAENPISKGVFDDVLSKSRSVVKR